MPAYISGYVELSLLIENVVPETAALAGKFGDDHQHETDRERDPQPGENRRERGRQVDAKDAFRSAHAQHRGRVARLGRDGTNALHGVDQDRETHAEGDHCDPHAVSEAEREKESRDDRDGRCRPRKLEQGVERSSERTRCPRGEPDGDTDGRSDREACGEALQAPYDLRENSVVGQISQACSSTSDAGGTRNDSAALAHSSQSTNAPANTANPSSGRPARSRAVLTATERVPRHSSGRRAAGSVAARR